MVPRFTIAAILFSFLIIAYCYSNSNLSIPFVKTSKLCNDSETAPAIASGGLGCSLSYFPFLISLMTFTVGVAYLFVPECAGLP